MPSEFDPAEFEILSRLAPATPAAGRLVMRFDTLGKTLLSDLLDIALTSLEQQDPAEFPTKDDVQVLVSSTNPRVRAVGVRLARLLK